MRSLFLFMLLFISVFAYADDDSGDDGFPSTNNNNMPPPTSPYANQSTTPSSTSSTNGGDAFGSMVQQQTNQAVQVFQNVNYQKLSGSEDQNDFSSDDNSDTNPPDPSHLFTVFSANDSNDAGSN